MWKIYLLNQKVEDEFLSLPSEMQAKLFRIEELIEKHSLPQIGMPYVRHIHQGELWEIRLSGKGNIGRGLYVTMQGKKVVLLRFFLKKSQKTPKKEINIALKRLRTLNHESIKGFKE
jgi:phage-related protein